MSTNYKQKFEEAIQVTSFEKLSKDKQDFIKTISFRYNFSFQEIKKAIEYSIDLSMWNETSLENWWSQKNFSKTLQKKNIFKLLDDFILSLRKEPKQYLIENTSKPVKQKGKKISIEKSDKKIYGMCPVASDKTVCCNLRNIDVVENCAFGCSYCTIQSFYKQSYIFDETFTEKLKAIPLDKNRRYHYCTGQSSDSLVWGNKNGVMDALINFAKENPNVILELKTKSKNVGHLLKNEIPNNIICSWSLNTNTIVTNEEHFTAKLSERLEAARKVADKGIKVSFHFHPIVYYKGWEDEYKELVETVIKSFQAKEIAFVSLGTLTFIKPVIKKIRDTGISSKILQMEFASDPHGKLTYPDSIKNSLFNKMLSYLEEWRKEVFFYLCMEKREVWEQTIGNPYGTNEEFEKAILQACFDKI
ncbi:MAG: hypothetical protein H7A23_11700 [Leptospiraceae bacterium]|nr:hypothetical protein [Leptospiraceae bacterium]MCP5495210.1 hypothetical protein [Leptospiraceae bacterium]